MLRIKLTSIYKRYLRTLGYSKYLSRYLFRIIQFGAYAFIVLIIINLIGLFLGKVGTLGPFGDFIGGILNPIFTFLMLIGVVITIVLQKKELSLARKEFQRSSAALESQDKNLEYQRFENTFFKLLEFFESCRNDIIYNDYDQVSGRDAIQKIYNAFINDYLKRTTTKFDENYPGNSVVINEKVFKRDCKKISGIQTEYNKFYEERYGEDLGQYFRTLYNILKFIDNNKIVDNKKMYSNLLRAQLSRYELSLLFYNCLSEFGEQKMSYLVKKYEILKHLEEKTLPSENTNIFDEFNA